jgi:nucleotide-binding universal stress UspA family protein
VLSQDLFTMIVAMALVTTLAMPPSLRWALRRLPIAGDEQKRLDREVIEQRGFVPNLERILLAVDDSPKGIFASRIAGLIAGSRGIPVTVVSFREREFERSVSEAETKSTEQVEAVLRAAEKVPSKDSLGADILITESSPATSPREAIAAEARKGYDLLVIGVEPTADPKGGFHDQVSKLAHGFEGAIAIITARGVHEIEPRNTALQMPGKRPSKRFQWHAQATRVSAAA